MKKIFLTLALITGMIASSQVRIGGTGTVVNSSAILELQSTTKGLLFPNVALTSSSNFEPLAAHVAGMTIYNTSTTNDVTPGIYTDSGSAWEKLSDNTPSNLYTEDGELTGVRTVSQNNNDLIFAPGTAKTIVNGSFKTNSIYGNVVNTGSSSSYSILRDDYIIVTEKRGNVTLNLPDATTNAGRIIIVVNNSSESSAITTVSAISSFSGSMTISYHKGKHFISDGVKWCSVSYN